MNALNKFITVTLIFSSSVFCTAEKPIDINSNNDSEQKAKIIKELEESWSAPERVYSIEANRKRTQVSVAAYGVQSKKLGLLQWEDDFKRVTEFPEPLIKTDGQDGFFIRRKLTQAITRYQDSGNFEDLQPFIAFLRQNPDSAWNSSILLNMAKISYQTGYFSNALKYWKKCWEISKEKADENGVKIASLAISEYAKMNARVGRMDEVKRAFDQAKNCELKGNARIIMDGAIEGHYAMENNPGIAFRCGPYALSNIIKEHYPDKANRIKEFLDRTQSPREGFSLERVEQMSSELGINMQIARRKPGASVIIPSVMHLKVGHFGAIIRKQGDKYLLKDPTFGNQTWLSSDAIDEEGSGFFIVPGGQLPEGWKKPEKAEFKKIYGKGHSGNGGEDETKECSKQSGGNKKTCAMATHSFHTLLASLHIEDTPINYSAARGMDIAITVSYNQREFEGQSISYLYSNFGPQWVSSWVSYLVDNTTVTGSDVTLYLPNGGSEVHTNFNSNTQRYEAQVQGSSVLEVLTNDTYKKVLPDGTEIFYEHFIGTTGTSRRVFMSRIVDPQGNQINLAYDTNPSYPERIIKITDATGLETDFSYAYSGEPYLVTSIEDPYGRTATFTYNSVSGDIRLTNIEDVYGINSSFQYDTIGRIDAYTTPYGTTAFELSDFDMGSYSLIRYIESTDPQGDKERIEYNLSASQTGIPGVINEPLPDSSIVNYFIYDNDDRNSFFWDKQQMEYGEGDYSKAHLYHWIQPGSYDAATGILESEKPPLEGRVWYNYPGQTQPYIQGTIDLPSVIGRVVYDENNNIVTQASTFEYNLLGYITREIDPVGRETKYEYDTNGVDILFIKQKVGVGPVYETIESRTYDPTDPPYVPRTVTDASGNTTTFSYNTYGQIQTITNELNEVITYTYETDPAKNGFGKVLSVTGDVPGGNVTYTYDSFDRIRTKTDSEGHTLTYDYDNLDRVTVITYPDSSFEQFDYQNHSLVATRDREGRWTRNFHNSLNQKVATIDPQSRLLQYEWCLCGHLRKLIDGEGSITHWKRDLQGRVKEKIFDDGTKYQYNYDFAGRLETITDPLNQTKTMSYYLDDQLKSVDYSDPETPDLSYTYDTYYLRQSTMVDGIGTTTYHYVPVSGTDDGALQVARMDGPFTDDTLKYTYDELGRVKKHEIVDDATFTIASHTETYQYDSRGRLDDITNDLGYFDYTYIGQSNRVDTIDYPNGMQIDYDYFTDTLDFKLKQIKNLNAAATPAVISQFDYTYRQDRNIQTWTTNQNNVTKTWTFDYNNSKELTSTIRRDSGQNELESYSYAYDRAGNRIHSANDSNRSNGIANALNQIEQYQEHGLTLFSGTLDEAATVEINSQTAAVISDGGNPPEYRFEALVDLAEGSNTVTIEATDGSNNTTTKTYSVTASGITKLMEYDANGNLRYERNPDQTVIREFQWDQENRLVKIINADNSSSEFAYNGQSKRVRIIEKNTSGTTTSNQVFIWCGPRLCQKRDSAGTTISRDYFSLGYQEGASTYFYTKDHLGSIREVVASDGITTSAIYDYSAWGTQSLLAGTKVSDFGYTGHYEHQPSDLTLTWFRAYDSQTGRWLSRDPIAENGGINLYAYVGGNPIGLKDPFGLEECLTLTGSEYGDKLFKQGYEMQLKVYSCVYGCLIGLGYDEAKTSAIIETMANAPKSSNNAVQCVSRGARFLGNLFKRIPAGVGVALSGYSYANCLTKCELSH